MMVFRYAFAEGPLWARRNANLVSLQTTATKISANPASIRPLTWSPANSTEHSTPNTDSRDKITDADAGSDQTCPTFWNRSATVVAITARYASGSSTSGRARAWAGKVSVSAPPIQAYSPAKANWNTVSR